MQPNNPQQNEKRNRKQQRLPAGKKKTTTCSCGSTTELVTLGLWPGVLDKAKEIK